jgi:predicted amidophosphoribosyltransferase
MAYQRAQWHSGLTYEQTCDSCKTVFQYTDHSLDFRPWYADGYVDCPRCKNHMRHSERYALGGSTPEPMVVETPAQKPVPPAEDAGAIQFCGVCGSKFRENDRFCSQCGAKRE